MLTIYFKIDPTAGIKGKSCGSTPPTGCTPLTTLSAALNRGDFFKVFTCMDLNLAYLNYTSEPTVETQNGLLHALQGYATAVETRYPSQERADLAAASVAWVWCHLGNYPGTSKVKFSSWFHGIVRNAAKPALTANRRQQAQVVLDEEQLVVPQQSGVFCADRLEQLLVSVPRGTVERDYLERVRSCLQPQESCCWRAVSPARVLTIVCLPGRMVKLSGTSESFGGTPVWRRASPTCSSTTFAEPLPATFVGQG